MIPARRLRLPILAALLLAVGWGAAAPASRSSAEEASPCRVQLQLSLSDKLVCPFATVNVALRLEASCPMEAEGRATVRSVELVHSMPAGIRTAPDGAQLAAESAGPSWHIDPFPTEGLTLTHQLRPILPGVYPLGEGLDIRIVDDRGRVHHQPAVMPRGNGELTVAERCYGQRRSSLYLPILTQPGCLPLRQPADIVLAVDRSTSLGPAGGQDARQHALAFLDSLHLGRDRVALIGFDQGVELLAPLGSSRAQLQRAVERLRPAPGTEIDRAIEAAAALLAGSGEQRRVLVLITDGVQTGPRGPEAVREAAAVARAAGLEILVAAVGPAPDLALLGSIGGEERGPLITAGYDDLGQAYEALGQQVACAR